MFSGLADNSVRVWRRGVGKRYACEADAILKAVIAVV